MATETLDFEAVLRYIDQAKAQSCALPTRDVPGPLCDPENLAAIIPYLDQGLGHGPDGIRKPEGLKVFATGWNALEGVLLIAPEPDFNADLRITIAATNERALRDLLFTVPGGKVAFFYLAGDWMLPAVNALFEGRVLPSREGYYATEHVFLPHRAYPARRLEAQEYALVQTQWSEIVWQELQKDGFAVHACHGEGGLSALCFHWEVTPWRNEVHGLQAIRDISLPYAESVVTSATEEVLASGRIPTCTANLSSEAAYLNAFRNVGFRPFYRVPSYVGVKRGTGAYREASLHTFFHTPCRVSSPRSAEERGSQAASNNSAILSSKDPLLVSFAELTHAAGRHQRGQFVVEGITLTQRALEDGFPIDNLLYTSALFRSPEGGEVLTLAHRATIRHHLVSDGLMGKVTTTRPVPPVISAVFAQVQEAENFRLHDGMVLLVAESIHNPDNLGMLIRTADAAGADGVLVNGCDPFHKNCVRAARGAVGRIPLLICRTLETFLRSLPARGVGVVGAVLEAELELYHCALETPLVLIVGNEQNGISLPVLEACTSGVRIPMAPGQDSLNVGVAAGLILYEVFRQKSLPRICA